MDTIVEIVKFIIKPYRLEEFREAMKEWVDFISVQPGFVSTKYLRSMEDSDVLIQISEYHYKFVAQDILEKYREKIGDVKYYRFYNLLQQRPTFDYCEKTDFLNEKPADPQE